MSRDLEERRQAFTGLLAQPVLDRFRSPELWSLIRKPRHRPVLTEWFASRLGYRLVITDSAARLFRLPLHDKVLAPRWPKVASRRILVLALLAAAMAEDAEDVTTTQDLSDRVRALTRHPEVDLAPYDPDRFVERQLFVKAMGLLVEAGALRPADRRAEEQREGWAHRRDTVGGAYEVRRELLLRMVDPASLRAGLGERGDGELAHESAARYGVMRRLIELPVCLYADLTDAERAYLASQRHRILAWCTEMTGWVVEQRAEGLALIAAEETETDLPFPRLRAVDFATLMVLDELLKVHRLRDELVDEDLIRAAANVRERYPRAMTKELDSAAAVRSAAVELLRELDLLRPAPTAGRWWLSPAAERFRDPRVVSVTSRLDELDEAEGA
jgi:uncharacterized protein (TIGR02678 family)